MFDRRNTRQTWNVAGIKAAGGDQKEKMSKKMTTNGIKVWRICRENHIAKKSEVTLV